MNDFKVGDIVTSCDISEEGFLEINEVNEKFCILEVWNIKKYNITLPFDEVHSHWSKK